MENLGKVQYRLRKNEPGVQEHLDMVGAELALQWPLLLIGCGLLMAVIGYFWHTSAKSRNRRMHAQHGNMPPRQNRRRAFTDTEFRDMLNDGVGPGADGLDATPMPEITFYEQDEPHNAEVHVIFFPAMGRLREFTYPHGTLMAQALRDLAAQMKVSPTRLRLNLNGLEAGGLLPTVKRVVIHFYLGPPHPERKRRKRREPQPASSHGSEDGLWYVDTMGDPSLLDDEGDHHDGEHDQGALLHEEALQQGGHHEELYVDHSVNAHHVTDIHEHADGEKKDIEYAPPCDEGNEVPIDDKGDISPTVPFLPGNEIDDLPYQQKHSSEYSKHTTVEQQAEQSMGGKPSTSPSSRSPNSEEIRLHLDVNQSGTGRPSGSCDGADEREHGWANTGAPSSSVLPDEGEEPLAVDGTVGMGDAIYLDCVVDPDDPPPTQENVIEMWAEYEHEKYVIAINESASMGDLRWRLGRPLNILPSWLVFKHDQIVVCDEAACIAYLGTLLYIGTDQVIHKNAKPQTVRRNQATSVDSSRPQLRLHGGANPSAVLSATDALLYDDETLRGALQRALPVCRRLRRQQVKMLLRADASLQRRIQHADDASIIKMVEAAARRIGMSLIETSQRPQSAKPVVRFAQEETSPKIRDAPNEKNAVHEGDQAKQRKNKPKDKDDIVAPDSKLIVADGQFDVPFRETLRPGENGVVLVADTSELAQLCKRHKEGGGTSAALAPMKHDDPSFAYQEVYLKMHHVRDGEIISTHMTTSYMYLLGDQLPKRLSPQAPVKITTQRASCVLGVEMESGTSRKTIWAELNKTTPDMREVVQEFKKLKIQAVVAADIIDAFLPNKKDGIVRCLLRVATPAKEAFLKASGCEQTFFTPPSVDMTRYPIVWYQKAQVANLDEARRLHDSVPQALGVACKRSPTHGMTYGIRTTQSHRDEVAMALGRLPGERYVMHAVPTDWDIAELKELCKRIEWAAEPVPASQRVKRNSATWTLRAVHPPPLDSIAIVADEENEVTVRISKPALQSTRATSTAPSTRKERPPTWASIVAQPPRRAVKEKTGDAREKQQDDAQGVAGEKDPKRRKSESPAPRSSNGVGGQPVAIPVSPPVPPPPPLLPRQEQPDPSPRGADSAFVVGTLQDLAKQMAQMQECMRGMHEQFTHLSAKVTRLDDDVANLNAQPAPMVDVEQRGNALQDAEDHL